MSLKTLAAAFIAVAALAAPVVAQSTETPRLDQRQINQQNRIDQGVQSGTLNSNEQTRLNAGQQRIANREANAKADGTVTRAERRGLQRAENRQSRRIASATHNNR